MASGKVADREARSYHTYTGTSFEVPSCSVGLIIGKGGRQVRGIEEESQLPKSAIDVSRAESKPGMRLVTIKGHQHNCEVAKGKIDALVELSIKRKAHGQSELGRSAVAGRMDKHLSFITFLNDTDHIVFQQYKGIPPRKWKDDDLYFLKACQWPTSIEHNLSLRAEADNKPPRNMLKRGSVLTVNTVAPAKEANMPPVEEMQHRLRNYSLLKDTLRAAMETCLRSAPGCLKLEASNQLLAVVALNQLETIARAHHQLRRQHCWCLRSVSCKDLPGEMCTVMGSPCHCLSQDLQIGVKGDAMRFGKVVWRSDGQRSVSDELLEGRHRIQDLERGGKVSLEDVLGGKDTSWVFQTIFSDAPLQSVKALDFPVIGDACTVALDVTMLHHLTEHQYLIRIKQNREKFKSSFEVLEVLVHPGKPYAFDCLNLERDLDVRIAVKCSPHHTDTQAVAKMKEVAEELCLGMSLRDGCLYVKERPREFTIDYARWAKRTMYLVSHQDKVHGECQYILAHYHTEDIYCTPLEQSRSAVEGNELQLQFRDKHHEVELWNCQWMVDFAALCGKTPEEVFTLTGCDPSKIKVHPKDKDKVDAASVISELDPFIACALQLALIDRD